jgi:hypothetical protein
MSLPTYVAYETGIGHLSIFPNAKRRQVRATITLLTHKVPLVRAALTMVPNKVRYPNRARYVPHIVLGDPSQRRAIVGPNNTIAERYMGVWICDAPEELIPGRSVELSFQLMYWPEESYEGVAPGATFTLREGPSVVGFGSILSEIETPSS